VRHRELGVGHAQKIETTMTMMIMMTIDLKWHTQRSDCAKPERNMKFKRIKKIS